MSVNRHLSTPGAEELLAWRKLSASEKPWRQIKAMVAVSGGISTEEILIKFSVDTDTKVFEMLTYKCTLRELFQLINVNPKRIRVLWADVSPASKGGHCDRVTVQPGKVVTASPILKTGRRKHSFTNLDLALVFTNDPYSPISWRKQSRNHRNEARGEHSLSIKNQPKRRCTLIMHATHSLELLFVGELVDDHVGAVVHPGDRHVVPPRHLPGDLVGKSAVQDVGQPGVGVKWGREGAQHPPPRPVTTPHSAGDHFLWRVSWYHHWWHTACTDLARCLWGQTRPQWRQLRPRTS